MEHHQSWATDLWWSNLADVDQTSCGELPNSETNEDTPKSFSLIATDPDGVSLTFTITQQPLHGQLTGVLPNVTYSPNPEYSGPDNFKFKVNDGQVFVNGAFAGTTKDARTLHLRPGSYMVEVRHAGQEAFSEQVFVTAGKTLHLHPAL